MDNFKNNLESDISRLIKGLLQEGKEYMYSELCQVLGVKKYSHGSNGQNAQLKALFNTREIQEIHGIYRGRKVKKYRIGKIKEDVLVLDKKRGVKMSSQKKSMYFYLLELLYSLAREGTHAEYNESSDMWKINVTNNALFKGLQMVNRNNYDVALYNSNHFCESIGVNKQVFSEVMEAVISNSSITIYRMLEKLEKLDLIYFIKTAMIGNNKIIVGEDEKHIREANFIENGQIKKIKRNILNEMNMLDERDVHIKGKKLEFYNKLKTELQEEMGIEYYCPVYSITFDKNNILDFIDVLRDNPDIDINLERSSTKFIKNLKKNSTKRMNNAFSSKSKKLTEKKAIRMLDYYKEHSDKILDKFHIDSDNIPKKTKT